MKQLSVKSWILWGALCTLCFSIEWLPTRLAFAQVEAPAPMQTIVFLSNDTQFIEDWRRLPAGAAPHIKTLKAAKKLQKLYAGMVIYAPPSMRGRRSFNIAVKLVAPDGTIIIDKPQYTEIEENIPNDGGYVLVEPSVKLYFDSTDLSGDYHAYAIATDTLTGTKSFGNYLFSILP